MADTATKKTNNKTKKEVKKTVKKVEVKEEKKDIKKPEVKEVTKKKKNIFTKKNLIIGGSILLVIVILLIVFLILFLNNPERKIKKTLENIGNDFYTNYYYNQLIMGRSKQNQKQIFDRFSKNGIKFNLIYLSTYDKGIHKDDINSLKYKGKECDKEKTNIIIYPEEPYGITDYRIELEIDCGF